MYKNWLIAIAVAIGSFSYGFKDCQSGLQFSLPGEWIAAEVANGDVTTHNFIPEVNEDSNAEIKVVIEKLDVPMSIPRYLLGKIKCQCSEVPPEVFEQMFELLVKNSDFIKEMMKVAKLATGVDILEFEMGYRTIGGVEMLVSKVLSNDGTCDNLECEAVFLRDCYGVILTLSSDNGEDSALFDTLLESITFSE